MKTILRCGVAIVALATAPAFAADLPSRMPARAPAMAAPVYYNNWTGLYLGGHAGGGWGDKCFAFGGIREGCHDVDGGLVGGQVGYNWQSGNLLVGLEFSGSYARLTGSHVLPATVADTYNTRVDSVFLLTGRVGWANENFMIYATGGGASARDRYRYVDFGVGSSIASETRWGWTVGAGVEFAFAPQWSVGVQYNYVDLGDRDRRFSGTGGNFVENIDQQLHLATVRLNYRFGGGGPVARY